MTGLALTAITLAALSAPPSVFAETQPGTAAPATPQVPAPSATSTPADPAPADPAPADPAPVDPAPQAPALPAQPVNLIRVGLDKGLTTATLSAPGGLQVIAGGALQYTAPAGTAVRVDLAGGRVRVAATGQEFAGPVRLVPVASGPVAIAQYAPEDNIPAPDPSVRPPGWTPPLPSPPPAPANPVRYGSRSYRGEVEIAVSTNSGLLSVVNVVNFEDYLLGVVPREMYSSWPIEALKVQAVAARTYARRHMGRFAADGYDVSDSPAVDQDYGGLSAEKLTTSQAVMQTRNQVLTYNGQLAVTYYHSSSGGHTENNEIIWKGSPVPYLRGVPDYDNVSGNTRYAWRLFYTPSEFSQVTARGGADVGQVITVAAAGKTGVSGRPSLWRLIGFGGSQEVTAEQFRWMLGLSSSPRSVTVQAEGLAPAKRSYNAGEQVSVLSATGQTTRKVSGARVIGADGQASSVQTTAFAVGRAEQQEGGIWVSGGGYGHAIGMSQWGANGMAQMGKNYVEILTHYYQGTKVETR